MRTITLIASLLLAAAALPAPAGAEGLPPPPDLDPPAAAAAGPQTAVLAGGCFWGVQAVFQHVKGVTGAVSGYAGGRSPHPTYEQVSSGTTGHAESVKVTFDPRQISYGQLLRIYFSVAHDPTEKDRQGPDTGSQYRSAIFTADEEQRRTAAAYIAQLDRAHAFPRPVATEVAPLVAFSPAEAYHQDYATHHPDNPYIAVNDLPKLAALQRLFPQFYRSEPMLVASAGMKE